VSGNGGVRLYRSALRCYPRPFREEYGADMVALLEEQLRDEHAVRVWSRLVADLLLTVPTRHLEVHMNRPPNLIVPALFAGVSTTGVLIVLISGAGGEALLLGSLLAIAAGILAVVSWRQSRSVASPGPADHWWKFLAAGGVAAGGFALLTSTVGELSEGLWAIAMVALVAAIALVATGLLLAVVRAGHRRTQHGSVAR
jgi:hypothetical protein